MGRKQFFWYIILKCFGNYLSLSPQFSSNGHYSPPNIHTVRQPPDLAHINRLAEHNKICNLWRFLIIPLYTVFLYPNRCLIYKNICSTFERTFDFSRSKNCSNVRAYPSGNFPLLPLRLFIRYSIPHFCGSFLISSRFSNPMYPASPYNTSSSSRISLCASVISCALAEVVVRSTPHL